jgi:hypothetical protein
LGREGEEETVRGCVVEFVREEVSVGEEEREREEEGAGGGGRGRRGKKGMV